MTCVWNSDDELEAEEDIRCVKVEKTFVKNHEIKYFCDCKFHYGTLYTFDVHEWAHLICEAGKNQLREQKPDIARELNFVMIKAVDRINVF